MKDANDNTTDWRVRALVGGLAIAFNLALAVALWWNEAGPAVAFLGTLSIALALYALVRWLLEGR